MRGQTLISLIFFAIIATTIVTGGIIMIAVNSITGSKYQQGELAYQVAQSGAENAVLRVLRDPFNYNSETLSIGSGTATITVTGSGTTSDPYIILSKGQVGNLMREVQVNATYINNQFTIISQKEVFN